MLTVTCVYVKGNYPYTVDYVVRLERMARRFITRPFEFVCLTDQPEAVLNASDDIGVIRVRSLLGVVPAKGEGHWQKVRLFDPTLGFSGRILYLDLDTLIVASLDPVIDFPSSLALTEDMYVVERAHLNTDRFGRQLVRRFNSSVMVWDTGTHADLWAQWTPAVAEHLSTDQDWIGQQAIDADGMPAEWFPRLGHLTKDATFAATGTPMPPDAKVILAKKPKNHLAVQQWPWVDDVWGGQVVTA